MPATAYRGRLLAAAILFAPATATASGGLEHHRLMDLHVIGLQMGENRIPHFAVDGRPARVIMAWRGNGNAHSFAMYLVVMPGGEMKGDWNVVGVDREKDFDDLITDNPYDGEQSIRTIEFAHAVLDRRPETLLITATRNITFGQGPNDGFGGKTTVTFEIYKLIRVDGGFGTPDQFVLVERFNSKKHYCNSELAFSQQFGTALPKDFPVNQIDGCP